MQFDPMIADRLLCQAKPSQAKASSAIGVAQKAKTMGRGANGRLVGVLL